MVAGCVATVKVSVRGHDWAWNCDASIKPQQRTRKFTTICRQEHDKRVMSSKLYANDVRMVLLEWVAMEVIEPHIESSTVSNPPISRPIRRLLLLF